MGKQIWKAGNMIYPLPAVMVSVADKEGHTNILTVAWTGTVCTNPAMAYISVRPERYSYHMIEESGEFVINLTTEQLAHATDFCGVRSGRDVDKWKECHLTEGKAESLTYAPIIEEAPVNIECKVKKIEKLGSHHMFLAEVTAVQVDDAYMNEKGKFELNHTGLLAYSHGEYLGLGEKLGTFGYSVKKKNAEQKPGRKTVKKQGSTGRKPDRKAEKKQENEKRNISRSGKKKAALQNKKSSEKKADGKNRKSSRNRKAVRKNQI